MRPLLAAKPRLRQIRESIKEGNGISRKIIKKLESTLRNLFKSYAIVFNIARFYALIA